MIDSTRSGRVGREAAARAAEAVVERDAGGEREGSLAEADAQAVQRAGVVAFEPEHVLARPEDRFDALADWREVRAVAGLVAAGGADDVRVERFDGGGEGTADVALVTDQQLAAGALA